MLAALHWRRCTRFALPHASSITGKSPGVVARFLPMSESKSATPPHRELCANAVKLQWLHQHFSRLLRARHVNRSAGRDNSTPALRPVSVEGFRGRNRGASLRRRLRDRTGRPVNARATGVCRAAGEASRCGCCSALDVGKWPGSAFPSPKTQYKCGKFRCCNNHPLGKLEYDRPLLLARVSLLSLE